MMAPPTLRTARKSTADTLVNPSPTTSPKSWFKRFPRPKRSASDGETLASSVASSSSTLPSSPIFHKSLTRSGTVGSIEVGSDVSDEKQIFSPISPQSTFTPPTSPSAQASPGSASTSPQSILKRFGASASNKQGIIIDHAPSTAMVVAKALVTFGEASNIPYLKGVAGLGLLILETAEGVTSNKEDCHRLGKHVCNVIVALDGWRERLGKELDPSQSNCLEQAQSTFEKVLVCIKKLSNPERTYTSRFLRQNDDAQNISQCEKDLQHAVRLFSLRTNLETHQAVTQMGRHLEVHHKEVMQQIETIGALVTSPSSKASQLRLSAQPGTRAYVDSPMPLRSCPKIFHGRDRELERLLDVVCTDSPTRVAVLGPGGVGKSTLVLRLLHHESIAERFGSRRFFIPCDSANSADSLIAVLASHFRLPAYDSDGFSSQALFKEVLSLLSLDDGCSSPRSFDDGYTREEQTILVLDNFESPWEWHESRSEVEELLGRIADLPNLTLVVTLRGLERPRGVAWTKPFLPPLTALDHEASRKIFVDITDYDYPDSPPDGCQDDLDALLDLCGDLPLAVTLMAHLAEVESVQKLLRRWREESTSMLESEGDDRRSNLDMSVMLSLESPRLDSAPDARDLLSILALLPDGVFEDDLDLVAPRIRQAAKCSATLRRTALAYEDENGRLKLLAPIRSFIVNNQSPGPLHLAALESYIWSLVKQTRGIEEGRSREVIPRVASQINNIESIIERTLDDDSSDPRPAVKATVDLAQFHMYTSCGRPRSMDRALCCSRVLNDKALEADCLYMNAFMTHRHEKSNEQVELWLKHAAQLYREIGDATGEAKCLQELSVVCFMHNRKDESYAYVQRAHKMHMAASNLLGQANTLMLLGKHADYNSDLKMAKGFFEESLDISTNKLHNLPLQANCLQQLADGAFFSSRYAEARDLSQRSLDIWEQLDMRHSVHAGESLDCLGSVHHILSRWEDAENCHRRAMRIYRKHDRHDRLANSLLNIAIGHVERGGSQAQVREAERYAKQSLEIFRNLRRNWGIAMCYQCQGDIEMARKDYRAAKSHYEEAYKIFHEAGWKGDEAGCTMKLGDVDFTLSSSASALDSFQRALAMYQEAEEPLGQARCLKRLGDVLSTADLEGAVERYLSAMDKFKEIGLVKEEKECAAKLIDVYWRLGEPELSKKYRRLSLAPLIPS
ncbi:TPR-like protein [Schizopora paradoxa]|uniref:TPR-like protein n=1 Tax=Schizopora paradoxa TaxID=27342 RepID=A0A0H2RZP4_9AGAM|nr:TPR-like protein [Schizopora paradoxa]